MGGKGHSEMTHQEHGQSLTLKQRTTENSKTRWNRGGLTNDMLTEPREDPIPRRGVVVVSAVTGRYGGSGKTK